MRFRFRPKTNPFIRPSRLLFLTFVTTTLVCVFANLLSWRSHLLAEKVTTDDLRTDELISEVRAADEVLTMSTRMAASTGEERWAIRYAEQSTALDRALDELDRMSHTPEMRASLAALREANQGLVLAEERSLKLTRSGALARATQELQGDDYTGGKLAYAQASARLLRAINAQTESDLGDAQRSLQRLQALIAAMLVGLLVPWWACLKLVTQHEHDSLAMAARLLRLDREIASFSLTNKRRGERDDGAAPPADRAVA